MLLIGLNPFLWNVRHWLWLGAIGKLRTLDMDVAWGEIIPASISGERKLASSDMMMINVYFCRCSKKVHITLDDKRQLQKSNNTALLTSYCSHDMKPDMPDMTDSTSDGRVASQTPLCLPRHGTVRAKHVTAQSLSKEQTVILVF